MSRTRFTDGWFFVRYADPYPHIRLRFAGDPNGLLTELLPEICAWGGELINEGMCQRFAFDAYDREIERYGGAAGMAAVEAIFTADSPAAVDLLAVLRKASDFDRATLAVASIDDLLSAIGLDGTQRHGWYKNRVKAPHVSGQNFRERKSVLGSLFGNANGIATVEHGAEIGRIFAERRHSLASIAERFAMLMDPGSVGKNRDVLLQSVVHMHCNRLAGADRGIEERALGLLLRDHDARRAGSRCGLHRMSPPSTTHVSSLCRSRRSYGCDERVGAPTHCPWRYHRVSPMVLGRPHRLEIRSP